MRFACVNDDVPRETVTLLAGACAAREIELLEVDARAFDFGPDDRLEAGDLLYRPAVSLLAQRVEHHLYVPGAATFYADDDGVYFAPVASHVLHERAGVPVARSLPCGTTDRERLRGYVERLGGFPVVMKVLGYSGGMGVMLVRDLATLFSLADYVVGLGSLPVLSAYVPDATHWRAIVVGDRMVASYRNPVADDDFRTYASDDPDDYLARPPADLAAVAIRAVRSLRFELGGVDVLEHPSGRLYVLEANFPCYFGHAQEVAGVDVAGAMVDHLIAKAHRLAAGRPTPAR